MRENIYIYIHTVHMYMYIVYIYIYVYMSIYIHTQITSTHIDITSRRHRAGATVALPRVRSHVSWWVLSNSEGH